MYIRGVFRTQSRIYDEDFLQKLLTAFIRYLFPQKKLHRKSLSGFYIRLCT